MSWEADGEDAERLARIEEKVDGIQWLLQQQNGRLSDAEDDITTLKVRDGYVAGVATAVSTAIAWLIGRN